MRYKLYYSPAQDAGKAYDLCGAPVEGLGELHGHTAAEPGGEFQLQLAGGGPHRGQCLAVCIGAIAFIADVLQRNGQCITIKSMAYLFKAPPHNSRLTA